MGQSGAYYSNVKIHGNLTRKIVILLILIGISYYVFFYSRNKTLRFSHIETFLGQTLLFTAISNSPLILL